MLSKTEASYLYPLASFTLAAAGTRVVSAQVNVVRVYAAATTTLTFGGSGAVVNLAPGYEYFRVRGGETLTAGGACTVTEMTG